MSWKRRYDFAITRSFPAGNFQLTVFAFLARFGSQKIEKYRSLLRRRQLAAAAGDVILRMGTLATVALRTPHITHTHTNALTINSYKYALWRGIIFRFIISLAIRTVSPRANSVGKKNKQFKPRTTINLRKTDVKAVVWWLKCTFLKLLSPTLCRKQTAPKLLLCLG